MLSVPELSPGMTTFPISSSGSNIVFLRLWVCSLFYDFFLHNSCLMPRSPDICCTPFEDTLTSCHSSLNTVRITFTMTGFIEYACLDPSSAVGRTVVAREGYSVRAAHHCLDGWMLCSCKRRCIRFHPPGLAGTFRMSLRGHYSTWRSVMWPRLCIYKTCLKIYLRFVLNIIPSYFL